MANELDYKPAGTGAVGCSTRAMLMSGPNHRPGRITAAAIGPELAKPWKSLRNLLAACFHLLFKTTVQAFQQLSPDLSFARARHAREHARGSSGGPRARNHADCGSPR